MRQKIIALWGNEYVQGGFLLTAASFIGNLLNYFFHFFAARVLGPSDYGDIVAFFSYIAIFSIPMTIFSMIIIQRISSRDKEPYSYASSVYYHYWRLMRRFLPFFLLMLLLIPFTPAITNLSAGVAYFIIPMILLSILTSFYQSLMQGLKLFAIYAVFSLSVTIFKLGSVGLPVLKLGGTGAMVAFLLVTNILALAAIIYFFIARKIIRPPATTEKIHPFSFRRFLMSHQFFLTAFAVLSITVFSNADIIVAKKYLPAADAGIFGSWSIFSKIILYVVGPVTQVFLVYFSDNRQKRLQDRILLLSLVFLVIVGVLSFIGYSSLGKMIVGILFGSKFISVVPYLGYAAVFGTFYAAINFFNTYFIAKKGRPALVLTIILPFYVIALLFVQKRLISIMSVDIFFAAVTAFFYLIAFLFHRRRFL